MGSGWVGSRSAKRIVTISSSYGAGGSVVGPALARALGVPFLDRAVPARVASGARLSTEEAAVEEDALRRETEARVRAFVGQHGAGVVLGWGATVVLPEAYRVRLHGPLEARLDRAVEIQGIDRHEAQRRQEDTDRVRSQYLRRLYGKDWNDPGLYHLVLDTTSMPLPSAVRLIAQAAETFWASRRNVAVSIC